MFSLANTANSGKVRALLLALSTAISGLVLALPTRGG